MANFKIPGWFVHFKYTHKTGEFNPGAYQERQLRKPTGAYNEGSFEARDVHKPSGEFNPGSASETGEGHSPDNDPWGAYYFSLEIDDVEVAHFLECSGLKTTAEIHEIEEGGNLSHTHKRTGRSKWENIILKRAVYKGHLFEEWRDYYLRFPSEGGWTRRAESTAAIVMRANDGETELRRFSIVNPWPVSWEGPSLSSGGSALAEETLEIAHEGILFGRPAEPEPTPTPEPEEEEELEPVPCVFDEADYTDEGADAQDRNVEELNDDPTTDKIYYVEGHTCDLGEHGYNLGLSKKRAAHAAADLEKRAGEGKMYESEGYSYDHPLAPNSNEGNRARNRRTQTWSTKRAGKRSGELVYQPMGKNGAKAPRY